MVSRRFFLLFILVVCFLVPAAGCSGVSYLEEWGIYELDPDNGDVTPVFTSQNEIMKVRLDPAGETIAFSMKTGGTGYEHTELYSIHVNGGNLTRLTDNDDWDLYPSWSPSGDEIAYLSFRDQTLDIWMMDADGENQRLIYDSGGHDADIHWVGESVAFTRDSQIWLMKSDGTDAHRVTDPPRAGEWGDAVLPFGDYDPRISPDGSRIVFERMVDDSSPHGNYDLFMVNIDGSSETRLTENGWTQGLASWSNDGQKLVYVVAGVGLEGRYDLYIIDPDGSGMVDITSGLFPERFLANSPIFSVDDSTIYFVGQWWDWAILDSVITCTLPSSTAVKGSTVHVSGSVEPLIDAVEVQVAITRPDGTSIQQNVTTEDGDYALDIQPDRLGVWEVQASWKGDSGHKESSSEVTQLSVVEEPEPENGGIPGFSTEAIIVGLILYYLKRAFS